MLCIFSSRMEAGGQYLPLYLFKNSFLRNQFSLKYGGLIRVLAPLALMCQMMTVVSCPICCLLCQQKMHNTVPWVLTDQPSGKGQLNICALSITHSAPIKSCRKLPFRLNLKPQSTMLIISLTNQSTEPKHWKIHLVYFDFLTLPWTWGLTLFDAVGTQLLPCCYDISTWQATLWSTVIPVSRPKPPKAFHRDKRVICKKERS